MSVNKRQILLVGGVAVLILIGLAVGRAARDEGPGTLDAPATQACDDFAAGVDDAETKTERLALADKVNKSSAQSDNEAISEKAAAMGRSANGSTKEWQAGADDFAQACRDAGWT
ncbi:hypothetical protein ACFQFC_21110 [Amorphoplanes digitatis]|uniref:Uncharacterized protein n=1 Tax=Actinoplanes digitatis TaxID=1868 RepID=A0A7W7MUF6_9ACTN|nr:hypothetical protein [Actinoplanes digitatis]MBB4766715.1 hypothetical protein [Actinoplanes digitatis]GID96680.1 hypothetical protein Adi01nite_60920 [Actinoplanes digitatis]